MKEKEKRILETFIVEKAQLQNMIDFFCYGEIFDELMNMELHEGLIELGDVDCLSIL